MRSALTTIDPNDPAEQTDLTARARRGLALVFWLSVYALAILFVVSEFPLPALDFVYEGY